MSPIEMHTTIRERAMATARRFVLNPANISPGLMWDISFHTRPPENIGHIIRTQVYEDTR